MTFMGKPAHKLSDSDGVALAGSWASTAASHEVDGGGDTGYATFLVLLPGKEIAVVFYGQL